MAKISVKLVHSLITRPEKQRRIVTALGLGKIGSVVVHEDTPNIMGMITKVRHLVSWQKVED
jgi:large subunit ribosomal protein L30